MELVPSLTFSETNSITSHPICLLLFQNPQVHSNMSSWLPRWEISCQSIYRCTKLFCFMLTQRSSTHPILTTSFLPLVTDSFCSLAPSGAGIHSDACIWRWRQRTDETKKEDRLSIGWTCRISENRLTNWNTVQVSWNWNMREDLSKSL